MRRYETIFITDPELQDAERDSLAEKLNELISQRDGALLKVDDWGQKRLAYEIKKKQRGHYIRLDYCGDGPLVDEMERLFRIDDNILKYMTVLLEKDIDVEAAKEEIAQEEAEKERILKEKAEANREAVEAAQNEPTPDKTEETATENKPTTDTDISDSNKEPSESKEASDSKKDSGEKE